jgi:hypothetical protein
MHTRIAVAVSIRIFKLGNRGTDFDEMFYAHNGIGTHAFLSSYNQKQGARGIVVVKALCHKPERRGFETQWGEWIFINLLSQKQKKNISGEYSAAGS